MNLFEGKTVYGEGSWKVTSERAFDAEEKAMISRAEVTSSDYGMSCCFFLKGGGQVYVPMSRDSKLLAGDTVDVEKAKILTLHREGSDDIERIME